MLHISRSFAVVLLLVSLPSLATPDLNGLPAQDISYITRALENATESIVPVGTAQQRGLGGYVSYYSALLVDTRGEIVPGKSYASTSGPVNSVLSVDLQTLDTKFGIRLKSQDPLTDTVELAFKHYLVRFRNHEGERLYIFDKHLLFLNLMSGSTSDSALSSTYMVIDTSTDRSLVLGLRLTKQEPRLMSCLEKPEQRRKRLEETVRAFFAAPSQSIAIQQKQEGTDGFTVTWKYRCNLKAMSQSTARVQNLPGILGGDRIISSSKISGMVYTGSPDILTPLKVVSMAGGELLCEASATLEEGNGLCFSPFFVGFCGRAICVIPLETNAILSYITKTTGLHFLRDSG